MKILLVEDDTEAASVLKYTLIQHYLVDLAVDGQVRLSIGQAFSYDIILLDMMLPKLDGIEFCRKLRSSKDDTPILLLTALDSSISFSPETAFY